MNIQEQKNWAETIRNKKSRATYLHPLKPPKIKSQLKDIPTRFGNIPVFIFEVENQEAFSRPVYINLHGGGFVKGRAVLDNQWCAFIAETVNCTVINIDYPLAPEFKFPKAIDTIYEIVQWLYNNGFQWNLDKNRIAIGGQSAGGNLATAVCLLNKEQENPLPIVYQILNYPPLDLVTATHKKPKFSDAVPEDIAEKFNLSYLEKIADRKNPLASPVLAKDLTGMPPGLIITAEFDSLRKEAESYANQLNLFGVETLYHQYQGVGHYFNLTGNNVELALDSWELVCSHLKEAFI